MRRAARAGQTGCSGCFNPHPPSRMDATRCGCAEPLDAAAGFNPHPPSRMDATQFLQSVRPAVQAVSIPIHPHGWMRRWLRGLDLISGSPFQSPSTLTDGCDPVSLGGEPGGKQFQSPSTLTDGCDADTIRLLRVRAQFQSPSTLTDGCDACVPAAMPAVRVRVSIPIHPHGWMRQRHAAVLLV